MIHIIHIGIGSLGQKIVKFAAKRSSFNIVGAIDPDPDKVGTELGELCGIKLPGITICSNLNDEIKAKKANAAIVSTVSSIISLENQILELAKAGINIVSTCEELFFPWKRHPEVSRRIDEVCRQNSVTCLGTGVNPGYLMDFFPTVITGLCQDVKSVEVWRVQDASVRRIPFQKKIGAGLSLEEFEVKKKEGTLRHVGLPESVDFIADRLGWKLDRNVEILEPVISERQIDSGYKSISKGMARGVHQIGKGFIGDREVITLNFKAAVGESESYDQIRIDGVPEIQSRIANGVNGDIATCAIILNAVKSVLHASPGLKTMGDIPPVTFFNSDTL